MKEFRYVLGSASPRRKEIFGMLSVPFEVMVSHAEEIVPEGALPGAVVRSLADQKARAVAAMVQENTEYTEWLSVDPDRRVVVIGSDTVVAVEDQILGKPKDDADAKRMLQLLSGRSHQVFTGVSVYMIGRDELYSAANYDVATEIEFHEMSPEEISWYVSTGECSDKAGAYAVQGYAARFIKGIKGDYWNVVGLPLQSLYETLKEKGCKFD